MEEGLNVNRTQGLRAHEANIQAGELIYNLMKSTLGPKGMDKLILEPTGNFTITNDDVTIRIMKGGNENDRKNN